MNSESNGQDKRFDLATFKEHKGKTAMLFYFLAMAVFPFVQHVGVIGLSTNSVVLIVYALSSSVLKWLTGVGLVGVGLTLFYLKSDKIKFYIVYCALSMALCAVAIVGKFYLGV